MLTLFKLFIFKFFMFYKNYFPIESGKYFISSLLSRVFGTFILKTHNNIKLELLINSSQDLSYLDEKNESFSLISKYIDGLKKGDIFIDIGANIGYLSIFASKKIGDIGRIYSFEPSGREYVRFLNNIHINEANNIMPFNVALSDQNKEIKFYVSPQGHTGLNKIMPESLSNFQNVLVPSFRLDYLLQDINKVNLIKTDVEGAEYLVLQGMQGLLEKAKIDVLIIEITPAYLNQYKHTKNMIYKYLLDYGYKSLINSDIWQYDEVFIRE